MPESSGRQWISATQGVLNPVDFADWMVGNLARRDTIRRAALPAL